MKQSTAYLLLTFLLAVFVWTPNEVILRIFSAPFIRHNETQDESSSSFKLDASLDEFNDNLTTSLPIVFFHMGAETELDPVRKCVIKAAATLHPNSPVKIYSNLQLSRPREWTHLHNVALFRLSTDQIFSGTALTDWFDRASKHYRITLNHDIVDALKYAYLYKYGGIVLDTDILLLKSLHGLENTLGMQDNMLLSNSVMVFRKGNIFLDSLFPRVALRHDPGRWGSLGPRFLADAATSFLQTFPPASNPDLTVLPSSAFNPVPPKSTRRLLFASETEDIRQRTQGSLSVHLWRRELEIQGRKLEASAVEPNSFLGAWMRKYCS